MEILKKAGLVIYRLTWYIPAVFLFSFWLFYFRAWHVLGHPPVSSLNDPKYLGLDFHHDLNWLLMVYAFYAFWLCLLFLLLKIFIRKMPFFRNDVYVFAPTAVLMIFTFCSYQMEWFVD